MGAPLPASFYLKLGLACAAVGAAMELVMINTGFYRVVTETEAQRWEEAREEREARARELRRQVEAQYASRGLELPVALRRGGGGGGGDR